MKSCSLHTLKALISGSAITTLGFPPNWGSFASISPKVLQTLNRPGWTLTGPGIIYPVVV